MLKPLGTRASASGESQIAPAAALPVSRPDCAGDPELRREATTFVAALPSRQRTALLLRLRHQVGYAEIASVLGCTEHEARSFAYDALRSLRVHLCDRL